MPRGMRSKHLIALLCGAVALAAALALVGGCGDEEPVEIDGRALHVRLDEYRIMPQNVRVKAGRLRIVATNVGRLTHNLKVVKQDEEDLEAPPTEVAGTRTAQPNESAAVTIDDLPPGEYRMICTIANHDDLGQYGKLIVEKG
jgi:plastocyanin